MASQIEVVPRTKPMLIVSIDLETECVLLEWLNCETPARLALINLGLDVAKQRIMDQNGDPAPVSS